jgi:chromate transporter
MILLHIYRKYRKLDLLQTIIFAVKCMTVGLITVTILRAAKNSILAAGSTLGFDPLMLIMTVAALYILRKWKPNPLWLMLAGGAINLIAALFI